MSARRRLATTCVPAVARCIAPLLLAHPHASPTEPFRLRLFAARLRHIFPARWQPVAPFQRHGAATWRPRLRAGKKRAPSRCFVLFILPDRSRQKVECFALRFLHCALSPRGRLPSAGRQLSSWSLATTSLQAARPAPRAFRIGTTRIEARVTRVTPIRVHLLVAAISKTMPPGLAPNLAPAGRPASQQQVGLARRIHFAQRPPRGFLTGPRAPLAGWRSLFTTPNVGGGPGNHLAKWRCRRARRDVSTRARAAHSNGPSLRNIASGRSCR